MNPASPLAALLAAALCLPAHGQSRKIEFRTLCLQHQDGIRKAWVAAGNRGAEEVTLYTGTYGKPQELRCSDDTASFFLKDPEAPDGRRVIASAKLASGPRQLFLLVPDPEENAPYRLLVLNDDEKSFPMGSVRLLNLCEQPVRLHLAGEQQEPVDPQGTAVYPQVKKVDEWNMYQARIETAKADGEWATVSKPSWKSSDNKRDFVVTVMDSRTKRPRVYSFKDLPPWLQ